MATTKATLLGHRSATSFVDLTLSGDLTVNGTTTTLDTAVQNVDKLEIGASSTDYGAKINQASTGNILQLQDGGTDVMVVEDGGKVGIGTNDPKSRLNVSDSGGFTTLVITDPTENASGEHWYFRNTGGNFYIGQSTDSGGAWDSLQARVTVRDGGNVDIGGASHDARRFSIKGTANDNSEHTIEVFNSDSTTIFKLVSDGNLHIPVGNVGIGTTTVDELLHVYKSSGDVKIKVEGAGSNNYGGVTCVGNTTTNDYGLGSFEAYNLGTGSEVLACGIVFSKDGTGSDNAGSIKFRTRDNAGNLAYRMSISSKGKLDVNHPVADVAAKFYGGDPGTVHYSGAVGGGRGAIQIGTTTSYHGLISYSDNGSTDFTVWNKYNNSNAKVSIRAGTSGGIYISGNTAGYTSFSDERLKIIDKPITDGLEKLKNVRTVIGSYKKTPETKFPMLIAQDFLEILPEAITTSQVYDELDGEDVYGLNYQAITPLMIKAIQELSAKVTALENA